MTLYPIDCGASKYGLCEQKFPLSTWFITLNTLSDLMIPFSVRGKKIVFGNIIKYLLKPSNNINSADLKLQKY